MPTEPSHYLGDLLGPAMRKTSSLLYSRAHVDCKELLVLTDPRDHRFDGSKRLIRSIVEFNVNVLKRSGKLSRARLDEKVSVEHMDPRATREIMAPKEHVVYLVLAEHP